MLQNKVPKPSDPQRVLQSQSSAREAWRMFEFIAEFVTATEHLQAIHPAVAIFGSARIAPPHPYYAQAEDIARRLSDAGFSVISGGGPGIMEAVNKGAQAGPSPSVGLNIRLPHEQGGNAYQDVSHTFQHFFARKVMFVKQSCAFVMMPGGYGTLDELFEVLTLIQTGKIRPLPLILVRSAFWGGLLEWIEGTLVKEGMISPGNRSLLRVVDDPQQIVDAIFDHYGTRGFAPSPAEREAGFAL
ncbi:Rossman fold protein, TIGR00730 family [Betaproteobacteria bacterium GR16-43]|nr:Rossman fold protein, TIGR00730 family [Betaproteobacteria bacterium GR16-43]